MKQKIIFFLLATLFLASCSKGNNENNEQNDLEDLAIVEISDISNFDLLVLPKNTSDYVYIEKNENNFEIPKTVLYHNSGVNKDLTILFDDDGIIDKILIEDFIIILRNFSENKLDLGIISPNGELEIFRNVETEFNWDTQSFSKISNLKKESNWIKKLVNWTSVAIDVSPCIVNVAHVLSGNFAAVPVATFDCGLYIGESIAEILVENEFHIYVPQEVIDDIDRIFEVFDSFRAAFGCLSVFTTGNGADECIGSTLNLVDNYILDKYLNLEEYANEVDAIEEDLENGSGLVAYYPLDGNANDESGNGNNGIANGTTLTADRNGNTNSAYNFQQSSSAKQYIESSSDFTINPAGEFSFSSWFNWDGNDFWYTSTVDGKNETTSYAGLMGIGVNETSGACYNSSATRIYLNLWNTGKIEFQYVPDGCQSLTGQSTVSDENVFSANSWNHVVVTHDGTGNLNIYLNNELVASRSDHSLNLTNFTSKINIGSMHSYFYSSTYPRGNTRNLFSGKIDDVRFYNKELTASEIQSLFTQ